MHPGAEGGGFEPPFKQPTSVFFYGPPGALLDWVAWAFVSSAPGGYRWTDIRAPGDTLDPAGPLARGVVPEGRLGVGDPRELAPDHAAANAAITAGIVPGESHPQLERLSDFLRLPEPTRAFLASRPSSSSPLVLVLSNGHRLLPHYTEESVRSALRVLSGHGIAILNVFPEVPSEARFIFDNVWHLSGSDPHAWRRTRLMVEKGDPVGPIPTKGEMALTDLPALARVLDRALEQIP